jgi:hypothetical protein
MQIFYIFHLNGSTGNGDTAYIDVLKTVTLVLQGQFTLPKKRRRASRFLCTFFTRASVRDPRIARPDSAWAPDRR